MKQIEFLPAGCSFWSKQILSSSNSIFAYSSTTSIYVYDLLTMHCEKILTNLDTNITTLAFLNQSLNKIVLTYATKSLYLCDITTEIFTKLLDFDQDATSIDVSLKDTIAIGLSNGQIKLYDFSTLEIINENSGNSVSCLKWDKSNSLCVGFSNGLIYIRNKNNKSIKKNLEKKEIKQVKWDPHSSDYILALNSFGEIFLLDSTNLNILQSFDKTNNKITSLSWIETVPGGFLTSFDRFSGMKIWNVSSKNPVSSIKTSSSVMLIYPLPCNQFLLSFSDKSIGIYDFVNKKILFQTEPSHSETIFDAELCPNNPLILATASYDGSIKLWDLRTMTCIRTMGGEGVNFLLKDVKKVKEFIIYDIAWHPLNENIIISTHFSGKTTLWDTEMGKSISDVKISNHPVHRVDWNNKKTDLIACGAKEGLIIILTLKNQKVLEVIKKIKINSEVYGVAWKNLILASAAKDGIIRLYDFSTSELKLISSLKGHTAKVFNVEWHPSYDHILSSSSDDCTIRIWNLKTNGNLVLQGHRKNVRPIFWHYEIPWILISGGWDAKLIVWDTITGKILHIGYEHHADIYAITASIRRPNLIVTCSRDNSIRFWDLCKLFDQPITKCVCLKEWESIFLDKLPNYEELDSKEIRFYGEEAKKILYLYKKENDSVKFYKEAMKFFSFHKGENDFWDLIESLGTQSKMKEEYKNNTLVTLSNFENLYINTNKNLEDRLDQLSYQSKEQIKDNLQALANNYLKMGNFKKYCETQIRLNNWEKAIAFAPAVSHEYWEELSHKYAEIQKDADPEEAALYYIATKSFDKAIKIFKKNGNLNDAKLLASIVFLKHYHTFSYKVNDSIALESNNDNELKIKKIVNELALKYLEKGSPFLSASAHLTINDIYSAITKLVRSNYMFEGYVLAKLLGDNQLKDFMTSLMRNKLLRHKLFFENIENFGKNCDDLSLMINYYNTNKDFIEKLLKKFKLPSIDDLKQNLKEQKSNTYEYCLAALNCSKIEQLISSVINYLSYIFKNRQSNEIDKLIILFKKLKYGKLLLYSDDKEKKTIFAYISYFGMKKAIWKGLGKIVSQLYKNIKTLLKNKEVQDLFHVDLKMINMEYLNFMMFYDEKLCRKVLEKLIKIDQFYKIIEQKLEILDSFTNEKQLFYKEVNRNSVILDFNSFPTNGSYLSNAKSILSNKTIKCVGYCLEDQKSYLEIEEAIMWSECNPFSPLNTGYLIEPY